MYPQYHNSPDLSRMHQADIRAQRDAIRQAKRAQQTLEETNDSVATTSDQASHLGALRRIFARAPHPIRFAYLTNARHG